ncbi:MAG: hypothetical protein M1499_04330, partial [Firmicutes bacterium]|nr:hypothetical protein [Bacillota bacterium]
VNAVPSGLANPVYQFWWAMQGGQWHQSGHYQSDPRYQFAPPKSGLVDVTVYARESSAPSNETPVQRAQYEAKADTLTVAVNNDSGQGNRGTTTSSAPGWVSLSTPNEVALGSPIVLTADAAGITQPVYQFWFWSPEGGWESSGHYSSSSTYTIAGSVLGQWDAVVYARPASAPSNETTSQRAEYEVTSPMTTVTVIQP